MHQLVFSIFLCEFSISLYNVPWRGLACFKARNLPSRISKKHEEKNKTYRGVNYHSACELHGYVLLNILFLFHLQHGEHSRIDYDNTHICIYYKIGIYSFFFKHNY